jgi:hypothetical protein
MGVRQEEESALVVVGWQQTLGTCGTGLVRDENSDDCRCSGSALGADQNKRSMNAAFSALDALARR